MDGRWEIIASESAANLSSVAGGDNLAYVHLHVSSTGKPKGVEIEHRALTNFLCSVRREPGLNAADILLSVTTLSFDIAALELYLPLIVGARLVIVSRDVSADGNQLKGRLTKTGANVMQATPATWRMLIDAGWQGSRQTESAVRRRSIIARNWQTNCSSAADRCGTCNGPTETTIWSTVCSIEPGAGPITTAGRWPTLRFIYSIRISIRSDWFSGRATHRWRRPSACYLHRPELTGEKIHSPSLQHRPQARLYKTGDLAPLLT